MKQVIALFLCLIPFTQATFPAMDCLSTSKQLREAYDHKELGPKADCTCPCDQFQAKGLYSQNRNQCLECKHFHSPIPQIFLPKQSLQQPKKSIRPQDPRIALQKLITKHTKSLKSTIL